MAHVPLLTRAELPQYGLDEEFLAQFDVRPIQLTAETAGALGTAAFKWRLLGDEEWSPPRTSSPRAPWEWSPPRSFCALAFAAGTYTTTAIYTIDEDGTVTRSGAGPDTITASRWDPVATARASVTDRATSAMQPRYVLPLLAWGDGVKRAAADWLKYELKSDVGMAPALGAVGDENIRLRYEDAVKYFKALGAGPDKSRDITDSSASGRGGGLMVKIASDEKAGF